MNAEAPISLETKPRWRRRLAVLFRRGQLLVPEAGAVVALIAMAAISYFVVVAQKWVGDVADSADGRPAAGRQPGAGDGADGADRAPGGDEARRPFADRGEGTAPCPPRRRLLADRQRAHPDGWWSSPRCCFSRASNSGSPTAPRPSLRTPRRWRASIARINAPRSSWKSRPWAATWSAGSTIAG